MNWEVEEAVQYLRDIKYLSKKYKRKTQQILDNLEEYKRLLTLHDNPLLMVEYSFVHRKTSGCHAITQQPLHSATQTRLYLYCFVENRQIHLICAGDKATQAKDNKYCSRYIEALRKHFNF